MRPTRRPFKFGAVVRLAGSGREWAGKARILEDSGFDVLFVSDHFVGPRFAPMPALMAAACATSRLRVGTMVLSNDYRHPVALAKEAATVDLLSGGRLELGIGTGWMRADYDKAGLPFAPPADRIERLAEALQVLKGLWRGGPYSFAGRHYRIDELECDPLPAQRPHPRILLGGGGPRMLRLAAREADAINLAVRMRADGSAPDESDTGLAAFTEKIEIIREAAGERWAALDIGTSVQQVGDEDRLESWSAANVGPQAETPQVLPGGVIDRIDKLRHWRDEHGLNYFVLHNEKDLGEFLPVVEALAGT
ncbi:TIGR03621 family F420-dependent LLM class oxidoreductase [Planotetraspora sp. A-T 1434]|uniref:TIGR03621 family F420-dependent LLM class oxidoreductase n=1 Tax=Planotetraspora sp. A-T 1434 TaxID=2979219 RepID=UPI0021BFE03F|nr:TIGR03621 family F420-dependent LLM class oxidoreductase [Planotetraspora sp. A-T 1434]MCT9933125.1 TIGR03621 family F420-dependent LLM class oxidoreductase [Planotetraspora sp. A-T 1434]